ncbi:hypothetical protein CA267_006315 [Alteromonas pelagimontana]|uniref:Uncharacterized protein n=1 Tax=Alteromonas pelagimontana TaxID=1858656 RepID=A0A6M4MCX8_9ALTE|nr:hypothetical protein [Alteromonas pelagimontana]QJR80415.1 hypothetical protein CA267_006315 [Alteromonas pelagimontana]
MNIEEVEIDGQLITVKPPVSGISINETTVTYQDATGSSSANFSSEKIAKQFASWLSAQKI